MAATSAVASNADDAKERCTIYVLRLRDKKWYVGRTTKTTKERFIEHAEGEGRGAVWTKLYAPVEVDSEAFGDKHDEDATFFRVAEKYGLDNVRGGSFCQTVLSAADRARYAKQAGAADDLCHKCGKQGHFAAQCGSVLGLSAAGASPPSGVALSQSESARLRAGDTYPKTAAATPATAAAAAPVRPRARLLCTRCGREGHAKLGCWAATGADGTPLSPEAQTVAPPVIAPAAPPVPALGYMANVMAALFGQPVPAPASPPVINLAAATAAARQGGRGRGRGRGQPACARCGRAGHGVAACFAKTHVANGHPLSQ